MNSLNTPIKEDFLSEVAMLIKQRKYIGLLYFTPLHELLSTTAILKELYTIKEVWNLRLSTGEEVRLDLLVSVNEQLAPGYNYFEDFTCDC